MIHYFRRSLELRAGVAQYVVYAVQSSEGERRDPVPVIAGLPENWIPQPQPGMCLFALGTPARIYETSVPRSQFRHYARISEADAIAMYPALLAQLVAPFPRSATTRSPRRRSS